MELRVINTLYTNKDNLIKIVASVNMMAVFEARCSNSVTCCVFRGVHPNHQDVVKADEKIALVIECM